MRIILLCLLLAGCHKPEREQVRDVEVLKSVAEIRSEYVANAALAVITNEGARSEFIGALNAEVIRQLAREPRSELERKLATLKRGSNRHHYTEAQLKAALERK